MASCGNLALVTTTSPLGDTLELKRWSQRRLEGELAKIGQSVTQQAVSGWVRGEFRPSPIHQAAIAHVLGVPAHLLFPVPSLVIEAPA